MDAIALPGYVAAADDDQARQVVYDQVQLDRYGRRQRRAILKAMARGKTSASHNDIRRAARRAGPRPRGETPVAIALLLAGDHTLLIIVPSSAGYRSSKQAVATEAATSAGPALRSPTVRPEQSPPNELTTAMDKADKAWLSDVGAGKVATTVDGSDALSFPGTAPPDDAPAQSVPGHRPARPKTQH